MSIIKKVLLVFMLIITIGCSNSSISDENQRIELICDGLDAVLDCFYENGDYKYCFSYQGHYLVIGDEKISIAKAIEEKKVTIDDVINLSNKKDNCVLYKVNKNTNEYEIEGQ